LIEPLADVEVNVPGVIAMLFAPVTLQARVLLEPVSMVVGLAVNESILGLETVTATDLVTVPTGLVAETV
jgi:hypothetical protein